MAEKVIVNTIMEGANHDSPSVLQYLKLPFHIPENNSILTCQSNRFLLYAATKDFCHVDLVDKVDGSLEGCCIESVYPHALWVAFESQRSFITRDGRVYVSSGYFEKDWKWYLDAMPSIIEDSRRLFNGEISENDINLHPKSVFGK